MADASIAGCLSVVAMLLALGALAAMGWAVVVLCRVVRRQADQLSSFALRKPYWVIGTRADGSVESSWKMEAAPQQQQVAERYSVPPVEPPPRSIDELPPLTRRV